MERRTLIKGIAATAACGLASASWRQARAALVPLSRPIHATGETMPVVGLGSWITFNVGEDPLLLDACADVIAAFLGGGGRMIDSSPMYGSSQATIGYALKKLGNPAARFAADKIWTSSEADGPRQLATTRSLWGTERMDLMQVHNLLSWRAHLDMLREKKASGEIRYIGITTSHGRRHRELERIMASQAIDFVQLTYNILDREPEARLLPLAR